MSRLGDLGGRMYRGESSFNIVGRRKVWYAVSAALILLSVGSILVRGLNLGIEFRGGSEFFISSTSCSIQQTRDALAAGGAETSVVTEVGSGNIRAQTDTVSPETSNAIVEALAAACGVPADQISSRDVGPTWGGEITRTALIALAVFLALLAVFLTIYFQWQMAVAALVALAHDILITMGLYALVGFEVTPSTVIGLLTILGYSLYDTVVVFDKVKENTQGITGQSRYTYSELANLALNQTIIRSINTSIVALLPVASILFVGAGLLGAGTLKDLALVLFIGTAVGTYSSIFVATPVLCDLKEREPAMKALTQRVMKRRAGRAQASAAQSAEGGNAQTVVAGSAGLPPTTERRHRQNQPSSRSQPKRQPRSQRKKG